MDIRKPVNNPKLVNMIREIKQGKKKEDLFWKEIFKSEFLCPIQKELKNTTQVKNQRSVLEQGTNIGLLSITNKSDEHYLMAFTDWGELEKWKQNENQQTLVFQYEDYQKIVTKDDSPYQGIVINPFGDNIVLSKQLLLNTRRNEHIVPKGEKVMLGIPKEYPTDMVNKLKEYFISNQNVDKAYLLWMVRGMEASYLLIVDAKEASQQLFSIVGQICTPFLNDKLLDIVLADSDFGKSAIKDQVPFFIRK